MTFVKPEFFYLLVSLPVLLILYGYAFWRKRSIINKNFPAVLRQRLLPGLSTIRIWLKALCLIAAVGLIAFSLTQPQWGLGQENVERQGRDIFFMLDVSLSMLAEDQQPNRLEHAKQSIADLVTTLREEGGHRLGLITFAGRASLQCPLTLDYNFFLQRLEAVNTDSAVRKGTLIGDAIRQALQSFGTLHQDYTDIILITDGEDHGSFPIDAAKITKVQNVNLYILGLGDDGEGTPIPVRNVNEQGQTELSYLQYNDHQVLSRLRQSLLLEIARVSEGIYQPAGLQPLNLQQFYQDHIAHQPTRSIEVAAELRPLHRFQWFMALAILLLLLDMLLPERNRTRV